jgi:hypothetical protein
MWRLWIVSEKICRAEFRRDVPGPGRAKSHDEPPQCRGRFRDRRILYAHRSRFCLVPVFSNVAHTTHNGAQAWSAASVTY